MKKILFFLIVLPLFAVSPALSALGISLGPFSLDLIEGPFLSRSSSLDTPICYAIQNHKQLEMIVETDEMLGNQEIKKTIKRLRIEPYVFGVTKEGTPQIKGNVLEESLVKEVTTKFGDAEKKDAAAFYSGSMQAAADTSNLLNFSRIHDFHVIGNSYVEAPENLRELLKDREIQVICHIFP